MADAPLYDPPFADCTSGGGCPAPGVCTEVIKACGMTWRHQQAETRIVYGARCSWWDSIDKVAAKPSGLPCCPHCGGVLLEVGSEAEWWQGVDEHEATGVSGYRGFIEWLRGKCFSSLELARAEFDREVETDG